MSLPICNFHFSLARVLAKISARFTAPNSFSRLLTAALRIIVCVWLLILAIQVAWRCTFPWDLHFWAESPMMTDLLKLDSGKPVFGPPEDGNSFFYSPGLTYLTYAVMKPLGLHLDIRYCRLVVVAVGMFAGIFAGWAAQRAVNMIVPENHLRGFAWLGAGIGVLVVFRNFNADVPHPDNLVMFHTAGLLWMTLNALQRRSFAWAVGTMVFAALGVFAKQTLCIAFIGPALIFLRFKTWGVRNGVILAVVGMLASGLALTVLWLPEFAKFYTWDVLTHHRVSPKRVYWFFVEFLHTERAALPFLCVAALIILWNAGGASRQYLQIWGAIGLCSVAPGALAFLKHFGTWNNLIIFSLWCFLLLWPAIGVWLSSLEQKFGAPVLAFDHWLAVTLVLFAILLLPTRFPPDDRMLAACAEIQDSVTADIRAGRRILVAHGTMYQLRAGSKEIPLDRVNSIVDLKAAGFSNRVRTVERIRNHYYDRLYLVVEDWYDDEMRAAFKEYYQTDRIIPKPASSDRSELGRFVPLIAECIIMSPRTNTLSTSIIR